jgi:hypothetical protein
MAQDDRQVDQTLSVLAAHNFTEERKPRAAGERKAERLGRAAAPMCEQRPKTGRSKRRVRFTAPVA